MDLWVLYLQLSGGDVWQLFRQLTKKMGKWVNIHNVAPLETAGKYFYFNLSYLNIIDESYAVVLYKWYLKVSS